MRFDDCVAGAEHAQRRTWVMLSGGAGRVLLFKHIGKHVGDEGESYTLSILPDMNARPGWPMGVVEPGNGVPQEHVIQTYPDLPSLEAAKSKITSLGFADVLSGDGWIIDIISQL